MSELSDWLIPIYVTSAFVAVMDNTLILGVILRNSSVKVDFRSAFSYVLS